MPELIVTIHPGWITIDGRLPDGYALYVHNHSGRPDVYPHAEEIDGCQYGCECPVDENERGHFDYCYMQTGVHCYLYEEDR